MSSMALTMPAELAEHQAMQEQYRVLGDMLARSATDAGFRALMLNDPHAAFAQFGLDVPKALDIAFIENHFDATIVLPDALDDLVEINDAELMQLNGGSNPVASAVASAEAGSSTSPASAAGGALLGAAITIGALIAFHYFK